MGKKEAGENIRQIREKRGLTQAEAAKKSGISVNYFARVERGEVDARSSIIEKIAKGLGVKSSDILSV